MNQLDIFLGGAVLLFALSGLFGGAVKRVLQVAALVIAFRESWHLTPYLQQIFGATEGEPLSGWMVLLPLLSFALVYILIRTVGGWFASLTKGTFLGVLDRVVGLVLGLLVGVYLMGYACLLFEGIFPMEQYNSSSSTPPTTRQSSYLYPRLMQSVEDIRHAKSLLLGDGDSKTTDTEAPTEATPASK